MHTEDFDELLLRPGGTGDLSDLVEVFIAATMGPGHPEETRSSEEVHRWLQERLEQPGRELWVASRENLVLGFVQLDGAWLNLIFVHPERPARGVGDALLDLVKALRPGGFGLRVHQANERARAFYRRHGLVELEATDGTGYSDATPDLQMAWTGAEPLVYLRGCIDSVDDELAILLARRTALTAAVQDVKASSGEYAGERGRDSEREAEIVARMAQHVPGLGPERIARVMRTVIVESLAAWESGPPK